MNGQPSPYSEKTTGARIALNVDPLGYGTIVVNGMDLSHLVKRTRLVAGAGELTDVVIEIPAANMTAEIEAALRVYIMKDEPEVIARGGSEVQRDAKRFRFLLALSRKDVSTMSPEEQTVHGRVVRGGWYTDDLIAGIDALLDLESRVEG